MRSAREQCDEWNDAYPVGTHVVTTLVTGRQDFTVTASEAWEEGGEAWVRLEGDRLPVRLERVEAL